MNSELQGWLRSAGRQRRLRAARRGLRSGLWACTAVCVAQTLARFNGLDLLLWMAPLALLGWVLGPLLALWRLPRGAMADALWVDRRLAGQSAFSTWLEGEGAGVKRDAAAQQRLQAWCLARLPQCRAELRALPMPAWPRTALAAAALALLLAALVEALPGWPASEPRGAALTDPPAASAAAATLEPDATGFGAAATQAPATGRASGAAGPDGAPMDTDADTDTGGTEQGTEQPAQGPGARLPAPGAAGSNGLSRAPEAPAAAGRGGGVGDGVGDRLGDGGADGAVDGLAGGPAQVDKAALLRGRERSGATGSGIGGGGPYDAALPAGPAPGRAGRPNVAAARPPRAQATVTLGVAETHYLNAWKQASRP